MKPILFSTPMVQAILAGRKTQTRRVIKLLPVEDAHESDSGKELHLVRKEQFGNVSERTIKPRYQPGDILWVRETFAEWGTGEYYYKADSSCCWEGKPGRTGENDCDDDNCGYWNICEKSDGYVKWRSSIHMPRAAARIFLRVTDVRVERIQDISYDNGEIWAEGIPARHDRNQEIKDYIELWDNLNAKRGYGWDANPWVWVYEFERVEKPEDDA